MSGFALLWSKLLDSSLWIKESKETRLVWIAMLAMKNHEGIIQASIIGLADRAKVSVDECKTALKVFLSPDPDDTSQVDEGRRIKEVAGGWQIVNHDLYRFSTEAKREFWRAQRAEQRRNVKEREAQAKRRKAKRPRPAGEALIQRAEERGDQAAADRVADELEQARLEKKRSQQSEDGAPPALD